MCICHIWSIVGWTIDVIQRLLTFTLSCILFGVVCVGVTACIMAGIAYGYNYSLTEFLTLEKSNVTVVVRRGLLHEQKELPYTLGLSDGADYKNYENKSDVHTKTSSSRKLAYDTGNYSQNPDDKTRRRNITDPPQKENFIDIARNLNIPVTKSTLMNKIFSKEFYSKEKISKSFSRLKNIRQKNEGLSLEELVTSQSDGDQNDDEYNDRKEENGRRKKYKHKYIYRKIFDLDDEEDYEEVHNKPV